MVAICASAREVVGLRTAYVRFGPKADMTYLLDHLVGAGKERQRHGDAERLCGLEVDHQLGLRRLLNGQVHRPLDQLSAKTSVLGVGYRSGLL